MKQILIMIVLLVAGTGASNLAHAQANPPFILTGLAAQKVPVTCNKMTNLVFPLPIRTGIKVSREVLVQKVKGVENVIELKAVRPHFAPTNLSVFGLDGRLYSFELEYVDNPPVLNFRVTALVGDSMDSRAEEPTLLLTGLPVDEVTLSGDAQVAASQKGFLHVSTRNERMRLRVEGIYLKDSLLWLVLQISNRSLIPYRPDYCRLFVLDRKKAKRMAIQQTALEPVYQAPPDRIGGRSEETFSLGLPLFTLARDKQLMLEVAERNGGRSLMLPIHYKAVLKARVLP